MGRHGERNASSVPSANNGASAKASRVRSVKVNEPRGTRGHWQLTTVHLENESVSQFFLWARRSRPLAPIQSKTQANSSWFGHVLPEEDKGGFGVNAIADICVVPLGVGVSVSDYVAACERIFRSAGLNPQLHAYGTNVEGPWDDVMAALKQCHQKVHEMGAPRISTTIRLGTRVDRSETIASKIQSVEQKVTDHPPASA